MGSRRQYSTMTITTTDGKLVAPSSSPFGRGTLSPPSLSPVKDMQSMGPTTTSATIICSSLSSSSSSSSSSISSSSPAHRQNLVVHSSSSSTTSSSSHQQQQDTTTTKTRSTMMESGRCCMTKTTTMMVSSPLRRSVRRGVAGDHTTATARSTTLSSSLTNNHGSTRKYGHQMNMSLPFRRDRRDNYQNRRLWIPTRATMNQQLPPWLVCVFVCILLLLVIMLIICYAQALWQVFMISMIESSSSLSTTTSGRLRAHRGDNSNVGMAAGIMMSSQNSTLDSFALLDSTTTTPHHTSKHDHVIPNILIFTHRINLLETNLEDDDDDAFVTGGMINGTVVRNNANKDHFFDNNDERNEFLVLQQNIRHIIQLHPTAQIRFLTDTDCIASIRQLMGHNDTALVQYFISERIGMFKADLCRGVALYQTGGLYFDVDLGVRMSMWDTLRFNTTFATVRVHFQSMYPGAFFQAFIATTPHHPIIKRYIDLFVQYYQGTLSEPVNGPLGVILLRRAFDEYWNHQRDVIMAMDEGKNHEDTTVVTKRVNNEVDPIQDPSTIELWQEVLYRPEYQSTFLRHVPPPTWGRRRACKFVVLTSPHEPYTVPFYSRIAGSRMCPAVSALSTAAAVSPNTTTTTTIGSALVREGNPPRSGDNGVDNDDDGDALNQIDHIS